MKEYKDLLARSEETIEGIADNGVKCKLLEDEMTFREINFKVIINEMVTKEQGV